MESVIIVGGIELPMKRYLNAINVRRFVRQDITDEVFIREYKDHESGLMEVLLDPWASKVIAKAMGHQAVMRLRRMSLSVVYNLYLPTWETPTSVDDIICHAEGYRVGASDCYTELGGNKKMAPNNARWTILKVSTKAKEVEFRVTWKQLLRLSKEWYRE